MSADVRFEALKEFLRRDPDDAFTRYALALEYITRGEAGVGMQLLRETVSRDPSYVPAWHMLAQELVKAEQAPDARHAYEEGIRVARSQGDTHAASEMQMEMTEAGL
jgi:Tfp pilus assembly protein PilF